MIIGPLAIGEPWHDPIYAEIIPWRAAGTDTDTEPVVIVEIDADTDDGPIVARYATHRIATSPADDPAHLSIEDRLISVGDVAQSAPRSPIGIWSGVTGRTTGDVVLWAGDGGLGGLAAARVDGRQVRVYLSRVARPGERVRDYRLIGGTWQLTDVVVDRPRPLPWRDRALIAVLGGDAWSVDEREARLLTQDATSVLRRTIQRTRYDGTGGPGGTQELADLPRPITLGVCYQVPAVLVDRQYLIYQVHDGPIQAIDAVYDRGVDLGPPTAIVSGGYDALVALDLAPGTWAVALDAGLFRLASPPDGAVTADVRGGVYDTIPGPQSYWSDGTSWSDGTWWADAIDGPGYADRPGSICRVVLALAGLPPGATDSHAWRELDVMCSIPCGIHLTPQDQRTAEQIIDWICTGIGAIAYVTLSGQYSVALPGYSWQSYKTINDDTIIAARIEPVPYRVPPSSWTVRWRRHWYVPSRDTIAGAVPPDRAADLAVEWRQIVLPSQAAVTAHPTARPAQPIDSPCATEAGAQAIAERLRDLYAPGRVLARLTVRGVGIADLGEVVHVKYSAIPQLANGRQMVIVGYRMHVDKMSTELLVFG